MRTFLIILLAAGAAGCGDDNPSSPADTPERPIATQTLRVPPAQAPGSTVDISWAFPVSSGVLVRETDFTVTATGEDLLPSPWDDLYKINVHIVSEGRMLGEPGVWELILQIRNESGIHCASCETVEVSYRLWD